MSMNLYFEALRTFLFIYAIIYILVKLPGVPKMGRWSSHNIEFWLSFILIYIISGSPFNAAIYWTFGFLYFVLHIYLLLSGKLWKVSTVWNIIIDIIVFSTTLFIASCIYATIADLPIKDIIHERFEDGGYSFSPGYLYEMIQSSIVLALLMVNFKYIHSYFLRKWEERRDRKLKRLQLEKKQIELQFDALQAKVNPHFLYNSLNSIAGLATVDGDKTRRMALALSRFFRYSMNKEQEITNTISEEAEMIETYLEIEKIRFGDKLEYSIEISNEVKDFKLPRMLLQPVVENCVKHGLKGNIEVLNIRISFNQTINIITISIKDDGTTFPDDIIPGYGIKSVYDKLDLLFPGKYIVDLNRYPEKEFRIILELCE